MANDLSFLNRAILLASYGLGYASPNPLMGWVITQNHVIIHEGWSQGDTNPASLLEKIVEFLVKDSTLYLNINPFLFFDQQEFIKVLTQRQIKSLVIPNDTFSLPSHSTIPFLILQLENSFALWTNRRFFTWKDQQRPYIILKWAETADGFIARENYDSKWISHQHSRKLVHQWRSQEDAILVGTRTYAYDNPQLNVRDWLGKDPIRIVLDRQLKLDPKLNVFDQRQPTICFNLIKEEIHANLDYVRVPSNNYEEFLQYVFQNLYNRKIQSLFVEGGTQLLQLLINNGWWDEARIFRSNIQFMKGIKAPVLSNAQLSQKDNISGDQLLIYQKLNRK